MRKGEKNTQTIVLFYHGSYGLNHEMELNTIYFFSQLYNRSNIRLNIRLSETKKETTMVAWKGAQRNNTCYVVARTVLACCASSIETILVESQLAACFVKMDKQIASIDWVSKKTQTDLLSGAGGDNSIVAPVQLI